MKVGDLVRETTKYSRNCSTGLVLETQPCRAADCECGTEEYLVHFFDDNDRCWMNHKFVEIVDAK